MEAPELREATEFVPDAELETMVGSPAPEGTPQSVIDALRQRRAALAADRHYDVDVPGYGGLLVLRLTPITAALWTRLADRVTRSSSPERNFNLNADTMIATCKIVLARARRDDPLVELRTDDGNPIRLDDQLAEILGVECRTARDVVRAVFAQANAPELTVNTTVGEYVEWCREANADLEEELLGEA